MTIVPFSCAIGQEGEVCVRGACVTAGYEKRAHMGNKDPNVAAFHVQKESRWLRTLGKVVGIFGSLPRGFEGDAAAEVLASLEEPPSPCVSDAR